MSDTPRSNGRIPHDYHTHTNVSGDSTATMAQMCQSALEHGLREIAFTDHFDVHPRDRCCMYYDAPKFFESLEKARAVFEPQGLTIRAGVELGEPHRYHDVQAPILERFPYDVVLGSLHWVGDNNVFHRSFYRANDSNALIAGYFAELERMVQAGGFDVVAHADVFKRVGTEIYGELDSAQWEQWLRPVWQACIDNGIGIEINTASLRRGLTEMHPSAVALRWYREMGGEILTLGSDGHQPLDVAAGLDQALELARSAGFTQVATFERRQVVRWAPI